MRVADFRESALASFDNAKESKRNIGALIERKNGKNYEQELIILAGEFCEFVANSVMNLHLGSERVNKALGPHVDLNYTKDGLLTPRSKALYEILEARKGSPTHRFSFRLDKDGHHLSSGAGGYMKPP